MEGLVHIRRALISVSDKTGLIELAEKLSGMGVEIISTGGTLAKIKEAGVQAISIQTFTGSPEILDGRVKTLHPKVHGGILFRRDDAEHQAEIAQQEYKPIDLVVVNLYPFEKTLIDPDADHRDKIENIDIRGANTGAGIGQELRIRRHRHRPRRLCENHIGDGAERGKSDAGH